MLNQVVISAFASSAVEIRFSNDGLYKIHQLFLDIPPVSNREDDVYTRVLAVSVSSKDSLRGQIMESVKQDDVVFVTGSLHINVVDGDNGKRYIPEIQIDDIQILVDSGTVAEGQEVVDPLNYNRFVITGRCGGDPEIKYFESGSAVTNLSVAVDRPAKDQTDWIPATLWGKPAETAANYVRKGSLIGLTGQLKFEHWTDKTTGEARIKAGLNTGVFIGGRALRLLGGSGNGNADNNTQNQTGPATGSSPRSNPRNGRAVAGSATGSQVGHGSGQAYAQRPAAAAAQTAPVATGVANAANYDDIPF